MRLYTDTMLTAVYIGLFRVLHLEIEFYLFVSHGGMNYRGSTCKFRNARSAFRNLHVDPVFYTSMRNKQVVFILFFKIVPFWQRNIRFNTQQGGIQNSQLIRHGNGFIKKWMSIFFLMFIVAENTGSVNICT